MGWYIVEEGEPAGPFTESEIRRWLKSGRLSSDTYATCEGLDEWGPILEQLELVHESAESIPEIAGPEKDASEEIKQNNLPLLIDVAPIRLTKAIQKPSLGRLRVEIDRLAAVQHPALERLVRHGDSTFPPGPGVVPANLEPEHGVRRALDLERAPIAVVRALVGIAGKSRSDSVAGELFHAEQLVLPSESKTGERMGVEVENDDGLDLFGLLGSAGARADRDR